MMATGIELISAERERQQSEEGWTEDHDKHHTHGELSRAAAVYAMHPDYRLFEGENRGKRSGDTTPLQWPFSWDWWKPTPHDRIRELTKAGALIAAEIDRLTREAQCD
jgi:hypothetical protein